MIEPIARNRSRVEAARNTDLHALAEPDRGADHRTAWGLLPWA
jgi:hypothetical protein